MTLPELQTPIPRVILTPTTAAADSGEFIVPSPNSPVTIIMTGVSVQGESAVLEVTTDGGTTWEESAEDYLTSSDKTAGLDKVGRYRISKPLTTNAVGITIYEMRGNESRRIFAE